MKTPAKLGLYVLGLAVVFAGAVGLGTVVGPVAAPAAQHSERETTSAGRHPLGDPPLGADLPGGLQTAQDGYRLQPITTTLHPGAQTDFTFQIIGPDGAPVTGYTPTHERDLHLIVVRRDLSGFQHVHPTLGVDGAWHTPLTVSAAGHYRIFADFQPAQHERTVTLGFDVAAPGDYAPAALPPVSRSAVVDGYTVELSGDLVAGRASKVTLRVSRAGNPVTDLQPYLGAYGHLVALRAGDLAYLHVHPDGAPDDGQTRPGPEVAFHVEVPGGGAYRLYLDFQHGGRVYTAEFTAVAADHAAGTHSSKSTHNEHR